MVNQRTKFMVGLFMAGGIGIGLVAVIWLGMSRFFEKGQYYSSYFDQSVQGLDIDSPVKYRGVSIGRVERIEVAPDSRLIKVILKIEGNMKLEKDMFAQLKVVGITGSMFIEMDRFSPGERDLSPQLNFPSEYPIVASKPSEISMLFRDLDKIMQQIGKLDLEGISNRTKSTLDEINQAVVGLDTEGISANLQTSLAHLNKDLDSERWGNIIVSVDTLLTSFQRVVDRFENLVKENETNVGATLTDFKQTISQTNIFVAKATSLVDQTSTNFEDLNNQLLVVGRNLENASDNLNQAIEQLSNHPSQLFFGEAPPPQLPEDEDYVTR